MNGRFRYLLVLALLVVSAVASAQEEAPQDSRALLDRATDLQAREEYAAALPLLEAALTRQDTANKASDALTGAILGQLATLHASSDNQSAPNRALERVKRWMHDASNVQVLQLAAINVELAERYRANNDFVNAAGLLRESLQIRQLLLGTESLEVAECEAGLGLVAQQTGDLAQATPLYEHALRVRERLLPSDDLRLATSLHNFASLLVAVGRSKQAEPLFWRALGIRKAKLGLVNSQVATTMNSLGLLKWEDGEVAQAQDLLNMALKIREQTEPGRSELADSQVNLASICQENGDYARAEPLLLGALDIYKSLPGRNNSRIASVLSALGVLYDAMGNRAQSLQRYEEALRLVRATEDASLQGGYLLCNIASYFRHHDQAERAVPLFQSCIRALSRTVGVKAPAVGQARSNLSTAYGDVGDYSAAQREAEAALQILREASGDGSADVAEALSNLAGIYRSQQKIALAVDAASRSAQIRETVTTALLGEGASRDKRAYFATLAPDTYEILSLHLVSAPDDPQAQRLAFDTLLRRKGRVVDAQVDTVQSVRRRADPADLATLDHLRALRQALAARLLHGPAPGESLATSDAHSTELASQADVLERDLARKYPGLDSRSQPVTLEAVQRKLEPGQALVEFGLFYALPSTPKQLREQGAQQEYVAYVLPARSRATYVRLGPVKPIDELIRAFGEALAKGTPYRSIARQLDAALMGKVRPLLGGARDVIVSPDGLLNLVPFGALIDEQDRPLILQYRFTYVTSGRDLLQVPGHPRTGDVLIANPDFGPAAEVVRGSTRKVGSFEMLTGSEAEARAIQQTLPQARLLVGAAATKSAVFALRGPRILHAATHGFLLNPMPTDALLGSGIALANANGGDAQDDNGLLTALEVSSLDLSGTELVTLSGCETGLGQLESGDGVYGLRRALVLAGSQSQILTLWDVNDTSTVDLMRDYYQGLARGGGRSEAMRQAQLKVLANPDTSHPHYWASFIVSGVGAPLGGGPTPAVQPVSPGARGCACTVEQSGESEHFAPSAVVVSAVLARLRARRRRAQKRERTK